MNVKLYFYILKERLYLNIDFNKSNICFFILPQVLDSVRYVFFERVQIVLSLNPYRLIIFFLTFFFLILINIVKTHCTSHILVILNYVKFLLVGGYFKCIFIVEVVCIFYNIAITHITLISLQLLYEKLCYSNKDFKIVTLKVFSFNSEVIDNFVLKCVTKWSQMKRTK